MNLCKTCGTICPFDDERTECDAYAPMTNENWFCSMHTEAKAEWLADHMKCSKCPQQNRCNGYHGGCVALMLEWLKEKKYK